MLQSSSEDKLIQSKNPQELTTEESESESEAGQEPVSHNQVQDDGPVDGSKHHAVKRLKDKIYRHGGVISPNLDKSESECQNEVEYQPEYKCIVCSVGFEEQTLCTNHVQTDHKIGPASAMGYVLMKGSTLTQFRCKHCPDMVLNGYQFDMASHHLSTHHNFDVVEMYAQDFQQFFKRYRTVQNYKRLQSTRHIKLACPMCAFSTSSNDAKRTFQYHVHFKHNMPLPEYYTTSAFLCSICGKQFASYNDSKKHERIHAGDTELCPICGKTFGVYSIRSHIKTKHSTEKYLCPTCGKAFKTKCYLKIHCLTHSDYKPYSCNYCDYESVNTSNMRVHLRAHHSDLDTRNGFKRNSRTGDE